MNAKIGNGSMKLVMDVSTNGVVPLYIGGLTVPITREDLIKMLFGSQEETINPHEPKTTVHKTHHKMIDIIAKKNNSSKEISSRAAKFAERIKAGLCLYCPKKHLKNKKFCRTHLSQVINNAAVARQGKTKKAMARAKSFVRKPNAAKSKEHLNGAAN